jgi:adenylosuccinate lyase
MIERYALPEMKKIWSDENKFRNFLKIEVLACEAQAQMGLIPLDALKDIQEKADFEFDRIGEIEQTTHHDIIAFLTAVAEKVGDASKYIHMGMTSSDIIDTGLSLQMVQAAEILEDKLCQLRSILVRLAKEYKYTLMVGRSHGIHAEPITFGLKMALWVTEVDRSLERLRAAKKDVAVGQISGAVGTFANINPFVEEYVCEKLGLRPEPVSTQIIQRDHHAYYMSTLGVIASSLDRFAVEIRNAQRTDILEAEEPFQKGQKGSSAMPHKKNPILCERISGLARVLRGNASVSLENVALWHERDISHSSAERIILPDTTMLLDYMLAKFIYVMDGLVVHPDNMQTNLDKTLGLVFSQRVLLALIEKGVLRETAYLWTQRNAMRAWDTKQPFKEFILKDIDVMSQLKAQEVEDLFDYSYHTQQIDHIFKRAGIEA